MKMIKIYYRGSCSSSRRVLSWFEKYNIEVQKHQISKVEKSDLLKILQLSDRGLQDILKRPGKSSPIIQKSLSYLESLSFNEALDFLLYNPQVLQTPIIIKNDNFLVGYNEDEIRQFLPKEYRRHRF